MQPARRVDDDRVEAEIARLGQRARRARHRVELARRVVHAQAGLLAEHVQLLDRRRTPHVGRHQQRVAPLLASATAPSLPLVVVLPEPCSPSIRITRGR